MNKVINYLWEAAGSKKKEIKKSNAFRRIGFDGNNQRLGWTNISSWSEVKRVLGECFDIIGDKREFIFVGMGGSINGVKTLASINNKSSIYCLDSLDPAALGGVLLRIKSLKKTMVISVSKSGTTKETQLISRTIRQIFGKYARNHFLWLLDTASYSKLDALGWRTFRRMPIQIDKEGDIGGRFSSPNTLIFLLPLAIILNRDFGKLKKIYERYESLKSKIAEEALSAAGKYKNINRAYFNVVIDKRMKDSFKTWVTQLFQESLGSKEERVAVKTAVVSKKEESSIFHYLSLPFKINNIYVRAMAVMYYLQNFVAFYAYFKGINFVNQPCVEEYKHKVRMLENKRITGAISFGLDELKGLISKRIKSRHKFIEAVLYFYPKRAFINHLRRQLEVSFPGRYIFVFTGSDWNHHSYQAASRDKNTLYLIVTKDHYGLLPFIAKKEQLKYNVNTLRIISYATYLTIKDNALFLSLKD